MPLASRPGWAEPGSDAVRPNAVWNVGARPSRFMRWQDGRLYAPGRYHTDGVAWLVSLHDPATKPTVKGQLVKPASPPTG